MNRLLFILLIGFSFVSFSQVDSLTEAKFNRAKQLMEDSLYFKANEVFVDVLNPDEIMPDELCFYFGKSLFLTGYKDQSRSFLYQYIALRDTSDHLFDPTIELLKLLGEDMSYFDPPEEKQAGDTTETAGKHHNAKARKANGGCHSDEVFICPVCNGTTVLVRRGSFGNSYQTCPYCDENGVMDCDTYKLYLSGELYNR